MTLLLFLTGFWIFPTKIGTVRKYGKQRRLVPELSCPVFTPIHEQVGPSTGAVVTRALTACSLVDFVDFFSRLVGDDLL